MRRVVPILAILVSSPMAALVVLVAIDPGGGGSTDERQGLSGQILSAALASSGVALLGLVGSGLAVSVLARKIERADRGLGRPGRFAARAERNRRRVMPVLCGGLVIIGVAWLIAPEVGGLGRAAVVSMAVGYQIPALLVGVASVLGQRALLSGLRAGTERSTEGLVDDPS